MIRSLSESIKISELLSEMNVLILTNINFDTHPLHQSMPEEVKQCTNIIKHLYVFIL